MHDNRTDIAALSRASGEKLYYRNRRFADPADDGCALSARDSEPTDNGTCAKGVTKAPPAPPPATGDAEPVEVWRPTHISPHYEVSNLGRIRSWRPTGGSAHGGVARAVTVEGMGHAAITAIPCTEDAVDGVASASSRATPRPVRGRDGEARPPSLPSSSPLGKAAAAGGLAREVR